MCRIWSTTLARDWKDKSTGTAESQRTIWRQIFPLRGHQAKHILLTRRLAPRTSAHAQLAGLAIRPQKTAIGHVGDYYAGIRIPKYNLHRFIQPVPASITRRAAVKRRGAGNLQWLGMFWLCHSSHRGKKGATNLRKQRARGAPRLHGVVHTGVRRQRL
jgi:hypothetical protein